MNFRVIQLSGETDWDGFRRQARALLNACVAPNTLAWHTPDSASGDLFAALAEDLPPGSESAADGETRGAMPPDSSQRNPSQPDPWQHDPSPLNTSRQNQALQDPSLPDMARQNASLSETAARDNTAPLLLPRALLDACESAALHRDPGRWALIYRLLWRLQREPGLRDDPIDDDRMRVAAMAQAVKRDMHKMKAFVRFRPIEREGLPILHVAWFEPEHRIIAALAPFFVRRFTHMHWAILTPLGCANWDEETLRIGPPAQRDAAPAADAGEALWLTYYRSIFNPARLKLNMMRKEMPRKYWHNLPEAALIGELSAQAAARSGQMLDAPATAPARRIVPLAALPGRSDATRMPNAADAAGMDPARRLAHWRAAAQHCRDCPIGEHATQAVWGEGDPGAALMLVGEQPGDQEDLRGRPFVGPAGQMLDRALDELGWQRHQLYVTSAVKHFKYELRGKRRIHKTAGQREAAACLQWLEREIELVRPRALIALGATAARALLGESVAIGQSRGRWLTGSAGIPVLVTLYPSALLRMDPSAQPAAWQAWLHDLVLASEFAGAPGTPPALPD